MHKAVIDIGTNTINLLIVSSTSDGFNTECFERIPAKLGQGGMMTNMLTEAAMERGIAALQAHISTCIEWQVPFKGIKVTATSAVRSAHNQKDFLKRVKESTRLDIEVIDGDREAELIWKGVRLTGLLGQVPQESSSAALRGLEGPRHRKPSIIMDIGGGSTEFILADAEQVYWMKSYDLGVTRIMERYQLADPFSKSEEAQMRKAITEELSELWEAVEARCCVYRSKGQVESSPLIISKDSSPERQTIETLIGASGSFDSLDLMLAGGDQAALPEVKNQLGIKEYHALSEKLKRMARKERAAIPGLTVDRVDTMPYAVLLIDLILEKLELKEMWRSSYALKEGLISELC